MQNSPGEHSAILLTCIKQLSVLKTYFCSYFEWSLKKGFTVISFIMDSMSVDKSVDPDQLARASLSESTLFSKKSFDFF